MRKGFAPILILVVIVVVAAIAGGAYYLGRSSANTPAINSSTPSASNSSIDETSDWETYNNSKFGYSIKHPRKWTIFVPSTLPSQGDVRENLINDSLANININPSQEDKSFGSLAILVENNPNNLNIEKFINTYRAEGNFQFEEYMVGTVKGKLANNVPCRFTCVDVIVPNGDKMVHFTWEYTTQEDYVKWKETFNKILSTFKFTQ